MEERTRRTHSPCRATCIAARAGKAPASAHFFLLRRWRNEGEDYVSGGNLLARWQHTTGEGSDIQIQAYFDRTNRQDFELGETRDTFDVDFVQHVRMHGDQELTWGLGARVSPSNFIQTSPGVNFLPSKQVDSIYSGFVQYELPDREGQAYADGGNQAGAQQLQRLRLPAQRAAAVDAHDRQSFWAAVTRAVRTPSRLDQDVQFDIFDEYDTGHTSALFPDQGDPKLKAEQLIGSEVGYRTQINRTLYRGFHGILQHL